MAAASDSDAFLTFPLSLPPASFDNVLVQLHGTKTISLWHPSTATAWRPRLDHKHWPGTSPVERAGQPLRGILEVGAFGEAVLGAGDAIFIPAMYFHGVSVEKAEGWSVSANRYYYSGGEGWLDVMEGRKGEELLLYEQEQGVSMC